MTAPAIVIETSLADYAEIAAAVHNDGHDTSDHLWRIAHWSLTSEAAWLAFTDYADAVRDRDALATGTADWSEFYDAADLTGYGSATEAAIDLKAAEADDALAVLLGHTGGTR